MKNRIFPFLFILFLSAQFLPAQNWVQVNKIVAADRAPSDRFGRAVSISGKYALSGAYADAKDTAGVNSIPFAGSAYLLERDSNGNWTQKQKIIASDRTTFDFFGWSVCISGNYLIVGADEQDTDASGLNPLAEAGAVYIFERDTLSNTWKQKQKIVPSDRAAGDDFGFSVAISGNYAAVGAEYEEEDASGANTLTGAGSVYIFERDISGTWIQKQKLVTSDRAANDHFGWSVSISGSYLVSSAYDEDEDANGGNTLADPGSVYIFERNGSGNWIQKQKVVSSDRASYDYFGESVSISGDYFIAGAYREAEDTTGANTLMDAGSAYIFEKDGTGNWIEKQKIVAGDRTSSDEFGWGVSISGNRAIISADFSELDAAGANPITSSGSCYIFERNGNGKWIQKQKLVASDRGANDYYGWSAAISGDHVIVGAPYDDKDAFGGNKKTDGGSVYLYTLSPPAFIGNPGREQLIFSVYPNPAREKASIEVSQELIGGSLQLFNALGELLLETKFTSRRTSIYTNQLPPGLYFIQVTSTSGMRGKQILIIE